MSIKLKNMPCDNCNRKDRIACRCNEWKEWFSDSWRQVQKSFGIDQEESFVADKRRKR